MRTPYFINKNTNAEYTPSPETLELVLEEHRQIHPEDVQWDNDFIPTLVTLCVQTLAKAFKDQPILDELDCADREHVLELLPTDLPLELVVPLINILCSDDVKSLLWVPTNYEHIKTLLKCNKLSGGSNKGVPVWIGRADYNGSTHIGKVYDYERYNWKGLHIYTGSMPNIFLTEFDLLTHGCERDVYDLYK